LECTTRAARQQVWQTRQLNNVTTLRTRHIAQFSFLASTMKSILSHRGLLRVYVTMLSIHTGSSFCLVANPPRQTTALSLFDKLFGEAFENDASLSQSDRLAGQIDGAEEIDVADRYSPPRTMTETQRKWQDLNRLDLTGMKLQVDLFLTGVPNKDPSNDLYGSQSSISTRDRQVGLNLPEKPSVGNVQFQFLEDGKVSCVEPEDSGFISNKAQGDWLLSDDETQVRFRFQVTGYTRRVETKGTIQSVFWSNEDDQTTQTSTVYSIPEGWLYAEARLVNGQAGVQFGDCVLKVEQSMGLLGVSSKMTPCGKFAAKTID